MLIGLILLWVMYITIKGELIDEGTLKPKPKKKTDWSHIFWDNHKK